MQPDDERENLVAQVREYGVSYLAPSDATMREERLVSPSDLIAKLASHSDPRLRHALIALFNLHPDWADEVLKWTGVLESSARVELTAHYMAAMYFQRMWQTRLGFYLRVKLLPDLFSVQLGLPSPDERNGKTGLHALSEWHAKQSSYAFNHLSSYHGVMDLLFEQLKREARRHEPA